MLRPSLAFAAVLGLSALAGCKAEPKVEDGQPLRFSLAIRANGSFGECADFLATPIPGGSAQAIADGLLASYERIDADVLRLDQSCAQHFAGEKALGTCDTKMSDELGELSVRFVYYKSVTPLAASKRDCLKGGYSWASL